MMTDRYVEYEFTDKDGDKFHAFIDRDYPVVGQIEYLKGVYEAVLARPLGPMTNGPQTKDTARGD